MNKKLRIGLLIDSYSIPAWAFKMLENIKLSEHSEIVLAVKKKQIEEEKTTIFKKIWKNRNHFMFILFNKIESIIIKTNPDAFEPKDLRKIIDCSELEVISKQTEFSDTLSKDDLENIKSHTIDVFIKLGFKTLKGDVLNSSKYGIWSYHHGDDSLYRGGPSGVWEVFENYNETGVILQILAEDIDDRIKIAESFSSTDKLSFRRNRNSYYWKALSLLPRKLKELHLLGEDEFFKNLNNNNNPNFYSDKIHKTPTNLNAIKSFIRLYGINMWTKLKGLFFFDQWILLYKIEKKTKFSTSFYRFKKILPPKDRFWADPFILERNEKYFIFIEELIYKEKKGKISVIEMDQNGNYTKPQLVLERDYHLSYPYLIEDNGELFMIPETGGNKTIELYKCIDFPLKWELSKVLMNNIHAVDTTIIKKNDTYWMFCNMKENKGASSHDELFLFYSDKLSSSDWIPHPSNPIVSDVKKSRPAGNIFPLKNKLYRPAQNCAKRYGHGMTINEITDLNKKTYHERTIQSIYPNWEKNIRGVHTLNNSGGLTIIDAIMKRSKI